MDEKAIAQILFKPKHGKKAKLSEKTVYFRDILQKILVFVLGLGVGVQILACVAGVISRSSPSANSLAAEAALWLSAICLVSIATPISVQNTISLFNLKRTQIGDSASTAKLSKKLTLSSITSVLLVLSYLVLIVCDGLHLSDDCQQSQGFEPKLSLAALVLNFFVCAFTIGAWVVLVFGQGSANR